MCGSRNNELLQLYSSEWTVFPFTTVMMLTGATDAAALTGRLNYNVRKGRLLNPRKGFYAKPGYKPEELCGQIYRPCYISFSYVLQRAGVIFQYDTAITAATYLSRETEVDGVTFRYCRMKESILGAPDGIRTAGNFSIACPERALLDTMYLNRECYFDNLRPIDRRKIKALLPIYGCAALNERVAKLFNL